MTLIFKKISNYIFIVKINIPNKMSTDFAKRLAVGMWSDHQWAQGIDQCAWGYDSSVSPTQTSCFPGTWWTRRTDKNKFLLSFRQLLQPSHLPEPNLKTPAT